MKRIRIRTVVFFMIGIALLGGAAVGAFVSGSSDRIFHGLAGDAVHDFGDVPIPESGRVEIEHTFVLRNMSPRALSIARIVTSCGCAVAEADRNFVGAGGEIRIDVTLIYSTTGRRHEVVSLLSEEGVLAELRLVGSTRLPAAIRPLPASLVLGRGQERPVALHFSDHQSDDEPPNPTVESEEPVVARFDGWRRVRAVDKMRGQPARWEGALFVSIQNESVVDTSYRDVKINCGTVSALVRVSIEDAPTVDTQTR